MNDSRVFYKLSYGVYVVASKSGNRINGQTANAVIQVTSEPQQIALGINRNNLTHEFIEQSGEVAISVLSQEAPLSFIGRFGFKSGRDTQKFEGVNYRLASNGCPVLLENTVGYLAGRVVKRLDVGTHTIFIVEVTESQLLKDTDPMTYAYYHQIKRGTTPKSAPTYIEKSPPQELKKKYQCSICGYVYDPEHGDPDRGVPPGTDFENLPQNWVCPVCGAPRSDFKLID